MRPPAPPFFFSGSRMLSLSGLAAAGRSYCCTEGGGCDCAGLGVTDADGDGVTDA